MAAQQARELRASHQGQHTHLLLCGRRLLLLPPLLLLPLLLLPPPLLLPGPPAAPAPAAAPALPRPALRWGMPVGLCGGRSLAAAWSARAPLLLLPLPQQLRCQRLGQQDRLQHQAFTVQMRQG